MKNDIRSTIQRVAGAVTAGLLLVAGVQQMRAGQQTRSAAHPPDWTNKVIEEKIWKLLEDHKSVFVTLPEADFRALGEGFDLPDGGKTVTDLATAAPGGAFDPRDLAKIPAEKLGYKAEWVVERYKRYNMDWDITGLKLTSLNPDANKYPWFIIMNGGAANFYEFFVDLKNRPGWGQFLAQKMNVMIVTIPGNFKYGGWEEPIQSPKRQPQYLLDRDLPIGESEVRNTLLNNRVVMQGLKNLVLKNTQGDILLIGHSTSGELTMLSYEDPELSARLKGRYLGWGSGGPARLALTRAIKSPAISAGGTGDEGGGQKRPLEMLTRRNTAAYSRGYSWFLNPLYAERGSPPPASVQAADSGSGARRCCRSEGVDRAPDFGPSQEDRKSLGCELRRRRQGSLRHALHAHGWIQENGLDRRSFRSESLASRRSYARARGLRGQRVQGREPGRADSPDCVGSAYDALRPPRVAEATRCRRLQRSEVAGQVG
ncbi:MAG: hypothetical protein DMG19_08650 [Acidobacteria bacterium]|nr:MAG: hypothetical protein DMG19_08650 [Acidobacteriota bacterium]